MNSKSLLTVPICHVAILISALLCLSFALPNELIAGQNEADSPPVMLPYTEMRQLTSEINGETYHLFIKLPPGYENSDTIYPTLFLTDANRVFPMVYNLISIYTLPNRIVPKMVVVGIGYRTDGWQHWAVGRHRDMTLLEDKLSEKGWAGFIKPLMDTDQEIVTSSGGAEKFQRFIKEELIPFVEAEYRVDPKQRTLMGFSRGGMFSLYTMFKEPSLFQRYFVASPAIGLGPDTLVFDYEQEYAATHDDLPVRLFMSVGENESENMRGSFHKMIEQLQSREYPSFEYRTRVIEDASHATSAPTATTFGLEYLFHTKKVSSGGE